MSLTDIKTKSQGFTIVELLIVVVVIAILAAITIVSYNGITNRANASAAAATAATVQKKLELYSADANASTGYPTSLAALTGASSSATYYLNSSSVSLQTDATSIATAKGKLTAGNGKTNIAMDICGTPAGTSNAASKTSVTGVIIYYFDYSAGSGTKSISVGDTSTAANCAVAQT